MNLKELRAAARQYLVDLEAPYLWSDAELNDYANQAQNEACRRARLIQDSTTDAITLLTLAADEPTVDLDPRILFIRRAKLAGRTQPLGRISYKELDRRAGDWETETGEPRGYVPDFDTLKFRPYPTPDADGEVRLTVVRAPLAPMAKDTDGPEIRPHLHPSLVYWMLHLAYLKQDSETMDEKKAAFNEARFTSEFGAPSRAIDENWIEREHGYVEDEGIY